MAIVGSRLSSVRGVRLRGSSSISTLQLTTSTGSISVSASNIGQTSAVISWTQPETSTWTISTASGQVTTGSATQGQSVSMTLNFQHTGTSYTLMVSTPHYSGSVTLTTAAYIPGAPSVSSHSQTANSITIGWSAITNATSYNVYWSVAGAASWQGQATVTGTSYTIPNLQPGTLYSVGIQAVAPDVI